ncbi:hypothetical protein AJ80_06517, partial [Polytolypa hystricis UAMH7299]
MICQYLTCAEAVTLMLSCMRFWQSRTGTGIFAQIWKKMMLPVGKGFSTAHFYVLRMLEYDGLLQQGSPSKYCCWGCMKPHKQQALLCYSLLDPKTRVFKYSFGLGRTCDIGSYDSFKQYARAVNIPLCPHIRLGDRPVVCLIKQPQMQYNCMDCSTTVKIDTLQFITIHVYRYIGSLCSPTTPTWRAQSYQTRHPRLEAHWQMFYNWLEIKCRYVRAGKGTDYGMFQPGRRIRRPFKGVDSDNNLNTMT